MFVSVSVCLRVFVPGCFVCLCMDLFVARAIVFVADVMVVVLLLVLGRMGSVILLLLLMLLP